MEKDQGMEESGQERADTQAGDAAIETAESVVEEKNFNNSLP